MHGITYLFTAFTAGIVLSLIALYKAGENVSSSILPEIFGFFLEGIIFVLIFRYYEKRRATQTERQLKHQLKTTLLSFLSIYISWANRSDFADPIQNFAELSNLDRAIAMLDKDLEIGLSENFASFHTRDFANKQDAEFLALLPVAAQIGPNHLFHWGLLRLQLAHLGDLEADKDSLQKLKTLLVTAQRFMALDEGEGK